MTDPEDGDEHEADAFVLVHQPTEGALPYGIGPFPPFPDLAVELIKTARCDCDITVLWVSFPNGITMVASPTGIMPPPVPGERLN